MFIKKNVEIVIIYILFLIFLLIKSHLILLKLNSRNKGIWKFHVIFAKRIFFIKKLQNFPHNEKL